MGEKAREVLKLRFDKWPRSEFHGARDNLGCRATRGRLTSICRGYIISDKSDGSQYYLVAS